MTTAPTNVIVWRPGPGPVKAREREGAVTTRAVDEVDEADLVAGVVEVVDFGGADVVVPAPPCVDDVGDGVDVDVEFDGPEVVVTPEPSVVAVDDVDVVVGPVVVGPVVVGPVVVVEAPEALAITGEMGLFGGIEVVMPEGVTESLGYAVHVNNSALPATVRERLAEESCSIVIGPEVAVNPPMVAGVDGRDNDTPASGTGLGMGTLKLSGPWGTVAGAAPLASS